MNQEKQTAVNAVEEKKEVICRAADQIWEYAELSLQEEKSAAYYCRVLREEGFLVEEGICNIPTAFAASFGTGSPRIGILAEYDALSGLSQEAGCTEPREHIPGGCGHGCGHNLLGAGAMAAAIGIKAYLEKSKKPGTVILYGCPGEEGGAAKAFMARDGLWKSLDAALTWHPEDVNEVNTGSSNSCIQTQYKFSGVASHAAGAPEKGRSALDALELMNVGVQFLREHVPSETRIHYAITDTGGPAPGTVQSHAEAIYLLRAVQLPQVKELYERVNKVARGAAVMTDTEVDITFIKACSNVIINTELNQVMQRNLEEVPPADFDEEDMEFARQIRATVPKANSYFDTLMKDVTNPTERARLEQDADAPIHRIVMPLAAERQGFVSSDVGDVSWNCPVAQINAATMPAGVAMHSWQMVAVGKTAMAKKGMLYAAKVMAGSAIDALEDPEIIRRAKEEHRLRTNGQPYESPIPADVKPRIS